MTPYQYTLFIDEAGDDTVERLRPEYPDGNSEWLCIGGYLVRSDHEEALGERRDTLLEAAFLQRGRALHYRNLNSQNRKAVAGALANNQFAARGFVICSFKRTMLGHKNDRAAEASGNSRDKLYNFALRLLLERVTEFVAAHGSKNGVLAPYLRIVLARRRGHRFGQFKAYIALLINQAIGNSTYLDTRSVNPKVLRLDLIEQMAAEAEPGLQLADVLVSAFFQALESASPNYDQAPARALRPLMATGPTAQAGAKAVAAYEGVTLFHTQKAPPLISQEQAAFFSYFGYSFAKARGTPK